MHALLPKGEVFGMYHAAASKLSAVFRPLVYQNVLVLDIIGELEQGFINHWGLSNGTHYQLAVFLSAFFSFYSVLPRYFFFLFLPDGLET